MGVLILYAAIIMPFTMVFEEKDETRQLIEQYMNIFFIIDIFFNFLTCYPK